MSKVTLDITMSLDGYIAGPNDEPGNGLGDDGEKLHEWVYGLKSWREPHGLEGGETNEDSDVLAEAFSGVGAGIVGRRMYDAAEGWGDDPPFNMPMFVLTHEERPPITKGKTTFTFVTTGIESALEQARAAAGDRNVSIGGGADTVQQFLEAGLIDEMQIHIAPLLLGRGKLLFAEVGHAMELESTRVSGSPKAAHLKYRIPR